MVRRFGAGPVVAGVRERWSAFAGTFVTLVLAVAIVSVTSAAFFSAGPRLPERLAGASVLVGVPAIERPDGNFTPDRPWSPETVAELTERLGGIPGVVRAVPDRSFYAQPVVDGRPGDVREGYGWSSAALAPYRLVTGAGPRRPGEAAVGGELGLAPGARVTVLTATGPRSYTVTGVVDGPGVHVSDAEAAALGVGVRTIGLLTAPGADVAGVERAARAVVGDGGRVFAGAARVALEPLSDARVRWIGTQVLTAMTAMGTFVSVFVVASTFAFAVAQRRREFALLRAVGATPRQVRRIVYGEALTVGVAASAVGLVLGAATAPALGEVLVTTGFEPEGFAVRLRPGPLAGSFAIGVVVALLGASSAARRAGRVAPLEALREAEVDERPLPLVRWIAGGVLCVGGLAGAVLTAGAGGGSLVTLGLVTAMALILGLALLGPALVAPVVRAVTWPLGGLRGATGLLVRESALTAVRRTASTAAPVLVTVGFAALVTGMVQTTAGAFSAARTDAFRAGAVMVPDGVPGLSDAAVTAGGGLSMLRTALYRQDGEAVPAAGIDAGLYALGRPGYEPVAGTLDGFGGDRVVVAPWVADQWGWRPGRTVSATFEDGRTVPLRVIGVAADLPASVLLARELVRSHDGWTLAEEAFVTGRTPSALPPDLGARVLDVTAYRTETRTEDDRLVWIFTVLLVAVSAGYTGVSIAGTLMMSAAGRVRDLLALRFAGATAGQVARVVAAESAVVVLLGTMLGLAVALPALLGMRAGFEEQAGTAVALILPWPLIGGVVGLCLLLAAGSAVAVALPAIRMNMTAKSG